MVKRRSNNVDTCQLNPKSIADYVVTLNLTTVDIKRLIDQSTMLNRITVGDNLVPAAYNLSGFTSSSDVVAPARQRVRKRTTRVKKLSEYMKSTNASESVVVPEPVRYVPLNTNSVSAQRCSSTMMDGFRPVENNYNDDHVWPTHSPYCCWNCTYHFDTPPVGIPDRYEKQVYHLYGNFCSYNCALSYLLYGSDARVDLCTGDTLYERKQLLIMLCAEVNGVNLVDIIIKDAPSKHYLDKFGGYLTIEEYRAGFYDNYKYHTFKPPLVPIFYHLEKSVSTSQCDEHKPVIFNRSKIDQSSKDFMDAKNKGRFS